MLRFVRTLGVGPATRVLDVGGTPGYWELLPAPPRVTLLNMARARESLLAVSWVAGDGRSLPFRDGAFDVVFSNSVIEHVGDPESQRALPARPCASAGSSGCRRPIAGSPWSSTC